MGIVWDDDVKTPEVKFSPISLGEKIFTKRQSKQISDLHFFSSLEPTGATDYNEVKMFSILVKILTSYSNFFT